MGRLGFWGGIVGFDGIWVVVMVMVYRGERRKLVESLEASLKCDGLVENELVGAKQEVDGVLVEMGVEENLCSTGSGCIW